VCVRESGYINNVCNVYNEKRDTHTHPHTLTHTHPPTHTHTYPHIHSVSHTRHATPHTRGHTHNNTHNINVCEERDVGNTCVGNLCNNKTECETRIHIPTHTHTHIHNTLKTHTHTHKILCTLQISTLAEIAYKNFLRTHVHRKTETEKINIFSKKYTTFYAKI